MTATFVQTGRHIDYTPSEDVTAGDVVALGGLVGVADSDIPADRLGALTIEGVYEFPKGADEFAAGDKVYWNATLLQATVDSGSANELLGSAVADAGSSAEKVRVKLNASAAAIAVERIAQTVTKADFTDNGDGTAYVDLTPQLPAGALVLGWKTIVHVGFTGDASAIMQVGVAGDLDDFSADAAQSVFTTGVKGSKAQANDAGYIKAATTVRVTVATAVDFADVVEGASMTIVVAFLKF